MISIPVNRKRLKLIVHLGNHCQRNHPRKCPRGPNYWNPSDDWKIVPVIPVPVVVALTVPACIGPRSSFPWRPTKSVFTTRAYIYRTSARAVLLLREPTFDEHMRNEGKVSVLKQLKSFSANNTRVCEDTLSDCHPEDAVVVQKFNTTIWCILRDHIAGSGRIILAIIPSMKVEVFLF